MSKSVSQQMKDVNFNDLTAFERSALRNIEAFCGQCENIRHSKNPSGFISASRMVIKESENSLYFFCDVSEHQGFFRKVDALLRMRRIRYKAWTKR